MKPIDMNYTLYGQNTLDELKMTFLTFYSREDFLFKLKEFSQVENHSEEYTTKRKELIELFRSRDLDFNAYEKATLQERDDILRTIPNREELVAAFLKKIFEDFYLSFPKNVDFWNRLLTRYAPKVFDDKDSLRLKILKVFQTADFYKNDFAKLGITAGKTPTEDLFLKLFDLADYVNWLTKRLAKKNEENILLTEKRSFKISENLSESELCEQEIEFFAYLAKLYDISKKIPVRCDELYLDRKITLIPDSNCLELLPCLGKSFFTVREYVRFFSDLFYLDNSFIDFDLDGNDKKALIENFDLKFLFDPADRVSDILNHIANSEKEFNNGTTRIAILESIEKKLFDVAKDKNAFKEMKTNLLLELHRDDILACLRKSADLIIGKSCGLSFDTWKEFFIKEVESHSFKFNFSAEVVKELETRLNATLPHDIELIKVLAQRQDLQKPGIEKTGIKMHNEVVEYLRQFDKQKDFRRAWDAHVKNKFGVLKAAENLSQMRIRSQRATKVDFYRFALLLNLIDNKGTDPVVIFDKILADIYTDNFFAFTDSNFSPEVTVLSEGINFKNYAETIYIYFLCRQQDLKPSERLTCAERCIQECKKMAAKNLLNPSSGKPVDLTKTFHDRFDSVRHLSQDDFKQFILDNYYIYSPNEKANMSPVMMASQMNSAYYVFNDLRSLIKNCLTKKGANPADLDAGVHLEDFLENLSEKSSSETLMDILSNKGFKVFLKKITYTLNIYERNLLNRLEKNSETFSRTDLIALYYVYFANAELPAFISSYEIVEWDALFNEFRANLDEYLIKAGYKEFSFSTIFDLFVLFSLYMKIVNEYVHPIN